MAEIMAFIKTNKYFVGVMVVLVILALIEMYGYSQKTLGEQTVVTNVEKATVAAVVKNEKAGAVAENKADKDIQQNAAANQTFDKKQGAAEVAIRKKYTTKKVTQVVDGKKVQEEITVPPPTPTVPNAMEAEISDSRIDDTWNRYCHFKQQDEQPCEK